MTYLSSTRFKLAPHKQDKICLWGLRLFAIVIIALIVGLLIALFHLAFPAFKELGFSFFKGTAWLPSEGIFGILPFVYGTFLTSFLAILIAGPISVASALFLSEICPKRLASFVNLFIEILASIPSIIFGLWGLFYLAPWMRDTASPFLKSHFGFLPFFEGTSFGVGLLTASLILALMIIPTITSICREIMKVVPCEQKEAALALGATRQEMLKLAVISPSFSGIMGALMLGLGRALGETMAVAMLIGNNPKISLSLFAPASTMASVIANEYSEAVSSLHTSALCAVAVVLFFISLLINVLARVIVWRFAPLSNRSRG